MGLWDNIDPTIRRKTKRTQPGKLEWEAIKKLHKNRCTMCGQTEKEVGKLEKAHLKAHSKGGTQYIPLCPNHHTKYDDGHCTKAELKKIGVDPNKYGSYKPKKTTPKKTTPKKISDIMGI